MMRKILLFTAALALVPATIASARKAPDTGTPATIQRLISCRSLPDAGQRLACYDRESATMDQALARRDLVIVDRARATAAKRSLFGFSVPDFGGIFGGDDDQVKEIASTVVSFGHNADGGWVIRLADGSSWSQTDDAMLGLGPRRGDKVVVRKGTFGNFFLRLAGQPGFKVRRVG